MRPDNLNKRIKILMFTQLVHDTCNYIRLVLKLDIFILIIRNAIKLNTSLNLQKYYLNIKKKIQRIFPIFSLLCASTSRRYGTKCAGCSQGISPSDLVRRARDKVFHLKCFTCVVCRKQLSTGEELYVLEENKFICKEDYINSKYAGEYSIYPQPHRDFIYIIIYMIMAYQLILDFATLLCKGPL